MAVTSPDIVSAEATPFRRHPATRKHHVKFSFHGSGLQPLQGEAQSKRPPDSQSSPSAVPLLEINDPEVSRQHCAVEVKGEVIRLRDLDSTNGTYINDERVRAAELAHLSEFRIGSTVVRVTITPKQEC